MVLPAAIFHAAQTVMSRCDALAQCTDTPGSLTRTFLSSAMGEAHVLVASWMTDAGLRVRVDAAGNISGRRPSPDGIPALLIGSHLDTVPNAGRYDGMLGVLAGIAVADLLRDSPLSCALEVIGFSEEEGVRFQRPYLGTMALAGCFDPGLLDRTDAAGGTMRQAIRDFGLDPGAIPQAALDPAQVLGYVELHIEQGPMLESLGIPLGVVETIIGQERLVLSLQGQAGHAGTVPMDLRRDAAVGLARVILAVQEEGRSVPGLRATVGSVQIAPNVRNVIPAEASFSIDVRHADDRIRQDAVTRILEKASIIAAGEGLMLNVVQHDAELSVPMDKGLTSRLSEALSATGYPVHRMISGAGHDAAVLAPVVPSAMLFVRNPGGISHHPDESVTVEDVAAALHSLVHFVEAEHQ